MKLITKLKFVAVFALLAAVPFAAGVYVEQVHAHEGEDHSHEEKVAQQSAEQSEEAAPEEAEYKYTAQPGDSYSLMARKAVQTYGINNKVNLSQAQIIYAETMLTQGAGSPELTEGQAVTIKEADVKSWVEKAEDLSDEDEAAWNEYTAGVDFNTDNVGEARS